MSALLQEANFDGIVGPTHNYAGLSYGNMASAKHAAKASNPRAAALQGLEKMHLLHSLGLRQGVIPPQPRPALAFLAQLGFHGAPSAVMENVAKAAPELLPFCYSSSGMWAANAATVTPSIDSAEQKVHFTPANLASTSHRVLEAPFTAHVLRCIFPEDSGYFMHHPPLPSGPLTADEGAANHMRLRAPGSAGNTHVFVYGRDAAREAKRPQRFPARQSRQAGEAVARLHGVSRAMHIQQNPVVIDAGVFHNDVIAMSHEQLLIYHAHAFAGPDAAIAALAKQGMTAVCVQEDELSVADTVATYLFNSQIVSLPAGGMAIVAPVECQEHKGAAALVRRWVENAENPIRQVHFVDLRQSMQNGGGPACLRLRVPLTDQEWDAVAPGAKFDDALYAKLTAWVNAHYRDRLLPQDLADPQLADEAMAALAALESILRIGPVYDC